MCRDNNLAKHKQGDTRPKVTSSEMPLKVAQSSDVSKFMSYIEVRCYVSHNEVFLFSIGYLSFSLSLSLSRESIGASLRKNNELSLVFVHLCNSQMEIMQLVSVPILK